MRYYKVCKHNDNRVRKRKEDSRLQMECNKLWQQHGLSELKAEVSLARTQAKGKLALMRYFGRLQVRYQIKGVNHTHDQTRVSDYFL